MSVTYFAYLCYPKSYYTDEPPVIEFEKPEEVKYEKIIPIQFSILHQWTAKDRALYND